VAEVGFMRCNGVGTTYILYNYNYLLKNKKKLKLPLDI